MNDTTDLLHRLASRRVLARLAILFERLWPALWPPLGVLGLFICAALLDLPARLPPSLHIALLAVTSIAVLVLLARGLRGLRLAGDAAADRRLELASGLDHRPLAVLSDEPADTDAVGQALWQAHRANALRQISRLRVGPLRPGLARLDRRALRGGLVVALVAALIIAGDDGPARLAAALEPSLPYVAGPPSTELQAWITPPGYTRLPPVFLKSDGGAVSVPAGSHMTASVTGGTVAPSLGLNGAMEEFHALDQASFQADRDLTQGGRLAIRRSGSELAAWDLTVVADQPPIVAWAAKPGRAPSSQQTRLPWQVTDDYGVTALQVEVRLDARPDAPPLVVAIPLPGGTPKSAHGINQQDLTAHPWAGLPVTAHLLARDGAGQTGVSEDAGFTLVERPFQNPIARVLIELRKGLSVHPGDRTDALAGLDTLLQQPTAFTGDAGAWLNLTAIYSLLVRDKAGTSVDEAQTRMWQLALHLEEGQTEQTARALEEARQAAREALEKAMQEPTDANREALEQRLKELEQAIERHMQALMEDAKRNQEAMPFDPNARQLSNRDLERMAERAREAARQGRMNEAQQRMAELERMLDQLRNARTQHGQDQQANARRQRGRQQMGAVQDMVGRQGGLLDHSESRVEQTMRFRGDQSPPTAAQDPAAEREADRRVQQALRRALGELMQQFGDLTGEVPPSLTEADQAMRESGQQLGQGHDKAAGDAEQQAIEALQKGAREMGQAMARQFGPGQNGEEGEEGEGGAEGSMGMMMPDGRGDRFGNGPLPGSPNRANPGGRDPLGRRFGQGSSGADESADVTVPEERERQRTQAIQEELRRRGGERSRPQQELDYINRLLRQF
jgi:uncharacterized protein (TIGR02302 family)